MRDSHEEGDDYAKDMQLVDASEDRYTRSRLVKKEKKRNYHQHMTLSHALLLLDTRNIVIYFSRKRKRLAALLREGSTTRSGRDLYYKRKMIFDIFVSLITIYASVTSL